MVHKHHKSGNIKGMNRKSGSFLYKIAPVILFLTGVILFFIFLNTIGFGRIHELFFDLDLMTISVFIMFFSCTSIFPAIAWCIHQRGEKNPISFFDSIKSHFMGFPLNFLTPSLYLGSEPLKIIYMKRKYDYPTSQLVGTLLVTKFQEFSSIALVSFVCIVSLILGKEVLTFRQGLLLVLLAIFLLVISYLFVSTYARGYRPLTKMMMLVKRFKRKKMVRYARKVMVVEDIVHTCIVKRWKSYIFAQLVLVIPTVSVLLRPFIIPALSGKHPDLLGFQHLALIYLISNFIFVLQVTPGALGVFEYGLLGYSALSTVSQGSIAVYSLLTRISDLIWLLLGLMMITHFGMLEFLSYRKRKTLNVERRT